MSAYRLICATLIHNTGETEMRCPAEAEPPQSRLGCACVSNTVLALLRHEIQDVHCWLCNQLDKDDNKRRFVLRSLTLKGYNGWQYSMQAISAISDAS